LTAPYIAWGIDGMGKRIDGMGMRIDGMGMRIDGMGMRMSILYCGICRHACTC